MVSLKSLVLLENNRYEAIYNDFNSIGTYEKYITVTSSDSDPTISDDSTANNLNEGNTDNEGGGGCFILSIQ